MRKLSVINDGRMTQEDLLESLTKERKETDIPCLVVFDGILDAGKLTASKEVEKMVACFYRKPALTEFKTDKADELHGWLTDQLYKSNVGNRSMIYPIKTGFDDLALDGHGTEYDGPLYMFLFSCEGFPNIQIIACHWSDGLFRNDYYVAGVIACTDELKRFIDNNFRR